MAKRDVNGDIKDMEKSVTEQDSDLTFICDKTFVLEKKALDRFTTFRNIYHFNGKLYVCTIDEGIKVYSENMQYLHTILVRDEWFIYSLAKLDNNHLVALSLYALYVMDFTGELKEVVSGKDHVALHTSDGDIYAIRLYTGSVTPLYVVQYARNRIAWNCRVLYHLPVAVIQNRLQYTTLNVGSSLVFITCTDDNVIYVLSKKDGTLIRKHYASWNDSRTSILLNPHLAEQEIHTATTEKPPPGMIAFQADRSDALLVFHAQNEGLLILHSDSSVSRIRTDPPLGYCCRAVYGKGKLYVMCRRSRWTGKKNYTLSMFKLV